MSDTQQAAPPRDDFERECRDGDTLLMLLGLDPAIYRTEGGGLNIPKIKAAHYEAAAARTRQLIVASLPTADQRPKPRFAQLIARLELAAHVIAKGGGIPQHSVVLEEAADALRTADQQTPLPDREFLGRLVRMEWMAWACEQPNPKPSWLTPWEALTEPEREVDRRIGERIHSVSWIPYAQQTPLRDEPTPLPAERDAARYQFVKAACVVTFDDRLIEDDAHLDRIMQRYPAIASQAGERDEKL